MCQKGTQPLLFERPIGRNQRRKNQSNRRNSLLEDSDPCLRLHSIVPAILLLQRANIRDHILDLRVRQLVQVARHLALAVPGGKDKPRV